MLLAHTALPDRNHSHSMQVVPVHTMRVYEAVNTETHSFLILALDAGELKASHSGHFTLEARFPTPHRIGGYVAPEPVRTFWKRKKYSE